MTDPAAMQVRHCSRKAAPCWFLTVSLVKQPVHSQTDHLMVGLQATGLPFHRSIEYMHDTKSGLTLVRAKDFQPVGRTRQEWGYTVTILCYDDESVRRTGAHYQNFQNDVQPLPFTAIAALSRPLEL